MRKKLNEWTKFGYKVNILAVMFFISLFLWFNFVSCEDTYIGKSKEEIEQDMIKPQNVDYGKITPLLVGALKEAITKIETLETQMAQVSGSN